MYNNNNKKKKNIFSTDAHKINKWIVELFFACNINWCFFIYNNNNFTDSVDWLSLMNVNITICVKLRKWHEIFYLTFTFNCSYDM